MTRSLLVPLVSWLELCMSHLLCSIDVPCKLGDSPCVQSISNWGKASPYCDVYAGLFQGVLCACLNVLINTKQCMHHFDHVLCYLVFKHDYNGRSLWTITSTKPDKIIRHGSTRRVHRTISKRVINLFKRRRYFISNLSKDDPFYICDKCSVGSLLQPGFIAYSNQTNCLRCTEKTWRTITVDKV